MQVEKIPTKGHNTGIDNTALVLIILILVLMILTDNAALVLMILSILYWY